MAEYTDSQLRPGEVIKPPLTKEIAEGIVWRLYGLKTKSLKEMDSYDDRNFHIIVESGYENPYIRELCSHGYTLKVANKLDSNNRSFIDSMNKALLVAQSKSLEVPVPVKNISGEYSSLETLYDENGSFTSYVVRLLTYLPGITIVHVPYTPSVLYQWGRLLAEFHQALKGHVDSSVQRRNTWWSLYNVPKIMDFLYAIKDKQRRRLVTETVSIFEDTLQEMKHLPTGVVHGDFNEHNILVQKDGENIKVCGILDFGDLHMAPAVFDVAVMLTYTMIDCKTMDPLEAPGHALAGYTSLLPLSDEDHQFLKICIAARLCQSLVMGAYTHSLDPSNEYVLSSSRNGWVVLEKLWDTPQQKLHEIWKNISHSNLDFKNNQGFIN